MNIPVNQIICGDNVETLRTLPDACVDSCVTDPPYGLEFMGKEWDRGVPGVELWREVLRVLKPGGHLLAFAGTRTQHRMATAIEDAGLEIRDMIAWVYGSGFPKSLDVSKAIDKVNGRKFDDRYALGRHIREQREANRFTRAQVNEWLGAATKCEHYESESDGFARVPTETDYAILKNRLGLSNQFDELVARIEAEREVVGTARRVPDSKVTRPHFAAISGDGTASREYFETAPATEAAKQWAGWGTALKPALEPITVARKPLCGTVAENVLQHGTGGLNVDGCRVGTEDTYTASGMKSLGVMHDDNWQPKKIVQQMHAQGRFPANLIHDGSDEVVGLFPETETHTIGKALSAGRVEKTQPQGHVYRAYQASIYRSDYADSGSAARFFYCAKAGPEERRQSKHPTIKPVALMRYLVRLVTPPGGLVLDPFGGSGTTAEAARLEHCRFLLMELSPEYCADANERLRQGVLF